MMSTGSKVTRIKSVRELKVRKVLLLCDFFSSLGGTERYNALLAEGLAARGVEVRIYVGEKPRLPYWRSQLKAQNIFYREPSKFHESLNDRDIERIFIADHVDEINKWKPDVIHVHPFKKMAITWLSNPKSDKSIPIVATEWTVPTKQAAHWFENDTSDYISNVHTYLATCNAIERGLRDYHGYVGNVVNIPHILKPMNFDSRLQPQTVSQSVGYIGRMSVEKGVDFLIGAWRQVHAMYPAATLHLYGHGSDQGHLEQLRDCLGLKDVVRFEGTFDPGDGLITIASRHSVFVQPSLFESIPTSLIELMLCGRTVVAADAGGIRELITPKTGMLVEPGSTDQISRALIELLGSPERVAKLGEAAADATRKRYDHDHVLDAILGVYESAARTPEMV